MEYDELSEEQRRDEAQFGEIDIVLVCIEEARRRAERAASDLRAGGADDFLVEALEQAVEELSATAKKLIQGTFFAVPKAQLELC
jgi:predicted O-methyltransferase YrrM